MPPDVRGKPNNTNFMKYLKQILLAAVAVFLILPASAREYRVALDGVAAALKTARPGDRIVVEEGTYHDMELKCGR